MWALVEDEQSVTISSTDRLNSCKVYKYGATVTSWLKDGQEQLFLSTKAVLDGSKAIRGGIPLVFPQFSQPNKAMPQHGVARTSVWAFVNFAASESATATFRLTSNEHTLSLWPHAFELLYRVTISAERLQVELTATNPSETESFSCQTLLHTYLRVPDIHAVTVEGFQNKPYIDKLADEAMKTDAEKEGVAIDREVDRIYDLQGENPCVTIYHSSSPSSQKQRLFYTTSTAALSSGGPLHPDCVLWNPWIEKARNLADLNDDAYLHYVCVEPGVVLRPVVVPPKGSLQLTQTIVPM